MRALVVIVAALLLAGCKDSDSCPAFVYNDVPCSTQGMACAGENGICHCQGNWICPGPVVHDLAVRDLSVRDLSVRDLSPSGD